MHEKFIIKKNARERLELSKKDLMLLEFLEQQRMLTLQQFYQAAIHLFEMKMSEYSFKNRIRKFEEYYLIRSNFYSEGFDGERFKYICIGSKSIDLLIENELLDNSYNKSRIYKFNQKKNLMHFLATQQAVINLLIALDTELIIDKKKDELKYPIKYNLTFFSHSPASFPYTEWIKKDINLHRQNSGAYHASVAKYMKKSSSTQMHGSIMTIVKPDWILEIKSRRGLGFRDAIINIELDMVTEPIETLAQKVFRYALLAEKSPDVLHIMNIVIADNSFSNRSKFSDGIRRAKNIVKQFAADSAVYNRIMESDLKVIIHPLRENELSVYDVLSRF